MKEHLIVVPGQPKGKGRPRFTTASGYPRTYTPPVTQRYEEHIKACFLEQVTDPVDKALVQTVHVIAFYQIPSSETKRRKQLMREGKIRPTVKPDLDNVVKVVLDALNGVAFEDDKQIVHINSSKFYSDTPKLSILLVENEDMMEGDQR